MASTTPPKTSARDGFELVEAAKNGNVAVVESLLKQNEPIDFADHHGETALHWACIRCHESVVQLLLDCGRPINVSLRNIGGCTPLHFATEGRTGQPAVPAKSSLASAKTNRQLSNCRIVSALVAYGFDVHQKDQTGATPLSIAARNPAVHRALLAGLAARRQVVKDCHDELKP